jgi:sporulation protein YlmC with PRC-barrel domain
MYLVRQVLDTELLDGHGHKIGKVDDLVLELRGDGPPVVRAIRRGQGTLAGRLPAPIPQLSSWLRSGVLGDIAAQPPEEVEWEHVKQIDVAVHLDVDREEAHLISTQRAIWNRWLQRLPWAER